MQSHCATQTKTLLEILVKMCQKGLKCMHLSSDMNLLTFIVVRNHCLGIISGAKSVPHLW